MRDQLAQLKYGVTQTVDGEEPKLIAAFDDADRAQSHIDDVLPDGEDFKIVDLETGEPVSAELEQDAAA